MIVTGKGAKNLMYKPLVSIIIPVYNGANYLAEAIESALSQTYENIEILVINDGSTDSGATERIACSYGDRIRYFKKENGGVSTALNYGISKMSGDWFSWLSHDDLYTPNKIKFQIDKLISLNLNKNNTILSCGSRLIDMKGKEIFHPKRELSGLFTGKEMYQKLFSGYSLNGCALLIPKAILLDIGGFKSGYKYIQDLICWVTLAQNGHFFYLCNEPLVKTRIHRQQQTNLLGEQLVKKETEVFLENYIKQLRGNFKKNLYYLTIILYYSSRINNKRLRQQIVDLLIEYNQYTLMMRFKSSYYRVYGEVRRETIKCYRMLFIHKYRKSN